MKGFVSELLNLSDHLWAMMLLLGMMRKAVEWTMEVLMMMKLQKRRKKMKKMNEMEKERLI